MDRRNYFEILNLPFDPPETNEKRFHHRFLEAFSEWERSINASAEYPCCLTNPEAFKYEMDLHDDMLRVMTDRTERMQEARRLQQKRADQLRKILDIITNGCSGPFVVKKSEIQAFCEKMGLSTARIEKIYLEKGFVQHSPTLRIRLSEVFLQKITFNELSKNLEILRTIDDPRYPWMKDVENIYELLCYLSGGDLKDAEKFDNKPTPELHNLAQAIQATFAQDLSRAGHLIACVLHCCTAMIFNTDENREKYNNSLKRAQLNEIFELIKFTPVSLRRKASVAEPFINIIRSIFPDYEIALAIYNDEAGLNGEPYEPLQQ